MSFPQQQPTIKFKESYSSTPPGGAIYQGPPIYENMGYQTVGYQQPPMEGGIGAYLPGIWALAIAIAVTVAAVLVGGLVFGIYICVVKADGDPTVYYPLKVAFWAGLAGGVFAFLVIIILYAVQKSQMQGRWGYGY